LKTFDIKLSSINDVKSFASIASDSEYEIDLVSGRYVIDAKSLMGIFSLDLTKPIRVEVHAGDAETEIFKDNVKEYCV
jgi:phosphocarrier protein HPr